MWLRKRLLSAISENNGENSKVISSSGLKFSPTLSFCYLLSSWVLMFILGRNKNNLLSSACQKWNDALNFSNLYESYDSIALSKALKKFSYSKWMMLQIEITQGPPWIT